MVDRGPRPRQRAVDATDASNRDGRRFGRAVFQAGGAAGGHRL